MAKAVSTIVVGVAVMLLAGQACAQAREDFFARDRNVAVRERSQPGYQALGLRLSSFLAYPKVELGVQSNDNVFGQPSGVVGDTVGQISPEIDFVSQWSRNRLTAYARGASHEYAKLTTENAADWQLGGQSQIDAGDSTLSLGGDYGYLAQPRTSAITGDSLSQITVHPVEIYQSDASLGLVHTINRLRLSGDLSYLAQDFQNGRNGVGGTVAEKPFSHSQTTIQGKAEYAVGPQMALYLSASYNTVEYPSQIATTANFNRNSSGQTYNLGANFDVTRIVRGDIALGVLHQAFSGGAGVGAITGLNALGQVQWFATQLTTLTFTGSRGVNPSIVTGSPAMLVGSIGGQVDHELLRNLILTGKVRHEQDDYRGVTRQDKLSEFSVIGDYLLNRNLGFHLSYDYLTQNSVGPARGLNFNVGKFTLSMTFQY